MSDLEFFFHDYEDQHFWAGVSGSGLIDIVVEDVNAVAAVSLDTTQAVQLADWLNAWIKTQQWQPEAVQP